ncbi:MAG: hypothetical protein SW833_04140 [Cyanobacteriota bacterium]|nr:hypothetical protein [Cyanobacteriota bacterium]
MKNIPAKLPPVKTKPRSKTNLLFERFMATLTVVNYLLVLFDLTYIPLRDFWLQGRAQFFVKLGTFEREFPDEPIVLPRPPFTMWYDWVKGIEPHRDTAAYLKQVNELDSEIAGTQLQSPEIQAILANLRSRSDEMIETNPFQIANKTGTLEKIKNRMRRHVFGDEDTSSKEAFRQFWSLENLNSGRYQQELDFFDQEIRPLIATNYYRPVGENGEPVDNFGLLDSPFFLIFALEFVARTWAISRRHTGVSWFDAMTWRWYDIFLLLPVLRWLRIIPVVIRLNQARLIDLHKIQRQASQGFVAGIAEDVTEVVVVNVLNQVQASIREGEIAKLLAQGTQKAYIDLNDVNETAEIFKLLVNTLVYQVMPTIKPDVEALLRYSIEKAVVQTPVYQSAKFVPGLEQLEQNLTKQLVENLYDGVHEVLKGLTQSDPQFDALLQRLTDNLVSSLGSEVQAQQSLNRLEYLLTALIEEVKVNYVQRLSQEDVEQLLDQTRRLRETARSQPPKLLS